MFASLVCLKRARWVEGGLLRQKSGVSYAQGGGGSLEEAYQQLRISESILYFVCTKRGALLPIVVFQRFRSLR